MRASSISKLFIAVSVLLATGYTIHVYMGVMNKFSQQNVKQMEKQVEVGDNLALKPTEAVKIQIKDTPKPPTPPLLPELNERINVCDMEKSCDPAKEIPFQIVSGAANIIGPSICVNGKWLVSNSIGNVNRGMNVAVIDGSTGASKMTKVFDLYGSESDSFKEFLDKLEDNEVVLITTYDDASFKLRDNARETLTNFGSKEAKRLTFRDNWIFVGGKNLQAQSVSHERHIASDKEKNRFGNWPASITLDDCLPRL